MTELEQLNRLLSLSTELEHEERQLAELGVTKPDWNDIASVLTYAQLVDAAAAAEAASASAQPLESLLTTTAKESAWQSAAPTAQALHAAVLERDRDGYERSYRRIERLMEVRALLGERSQLGERPASAAQDLADAVLADPQRRDWDTWLKDLPAAWNWSRTGAWILEQDTTDANVVQAQITAIGRTDPSRDRGSRGHPRLEPCSRLGPADGNCPRGPHPVRPTRQVAWKGHGEVRECEAG